MGLIADLWQDVQFLRRALTLLRTVKRLPPTIEMTAADLLEGWAARTPQAPAILFEDRTVSYAEFDAAASRYAEWARSLGIARGDIVALLMENEPDYLFAWMGLAKIGATSALINTHQRSGALAHSLNLAGARHLILGAGLAEAYDSAARELNARPIAWTIGGDVPGTENLAAALAAQAGRPVGREARAGMQARQALFYIYTSGTTGLPKAARFPHVRFLHAGNAFAIATDTRRIDRLYNALPLYHSAGGVAAVANVMVRGATLALARRFSVHGFWDDVVRHEASMFQYIGELCRYLMNRPVSEREQDHRLRLAVGNGLRPDIWEAFQARFKIPRIVEFYGSTEGNVTLFNVDGKPGAIGRVPPFLKKSFPARLVRYDTAAQDIVRGPDGFAIEAKPGEVGEALGVISNDPRHLFEGYTRREETKRKILENVFKPGDRYFRTGDLLRQDERGYFYFVDRVGDTFRWKGENVSTAEVARVLGHVPGVKEANVYGVAIPGTDGRAGMAALVVGGAFDAGALAEHLMRELPRYAVPIFLRLQSEIAVTGTFKHRKVDLVAEGFDPARITERLYFLDPGAGTYVPLDEERYHLIVNGAIKL